jgi:hypothetical protein
MMRIRYTTSFLKLYVTEIINLNDKKLAYLFLKK